jgi:hypothetical protein
MEVCACYEYACRPCSYPCPVRRHSFRSFYPSGRPDWFMWAVRGIGKSHHHRRRRRSVSTFSGTKLRQYAGGKRRNQCIINLCTDIPVGLQGRGRRAGHGDETGSFLHSTPLPKATAVMVYKCLFAAHTDSRTRDVRREIKKKDLSFVTDISACCAGTHAAFEQPGDHYLGTTPCGEQC